MREWLPFHEKKWKIGNKGKKIFVSKCQFGWQERTLSSRDFDCRIRQKKDCSATSETPLSYRIFQRYFQNFREKSREILEIF